MHALLDYLEAAGFPYSPRVVGTDAGSDVLTYIDGASGAEGWSSVAEESGLTAAARMLRTYHDTVAAWRPERAPVWFNGTAGTGGPGEVVCHGDFAPWNIIWHGTKPVGLVDWEYASLGPPRRDVAYALDCMAPFRTDADCVTLLRYPEPPDRSRRIALFAEAYGLTSTDWLVDAVIANQIGAIETVRGLAAEGHERQIAMVADGYPERLEQHVDWIDRHRGLF
ncbi:MAG: aminoglycoside phosphotransferase family protein [Actinopolymorphaceae bacterium]